MSGKVKPIDYLVAGLGKRGVFRARWPAGAVAQFRRKYRIGFVRADQETGAWVGISVAPLASRRRR